MAKAPVEPAKPGDWRESWGKVEPWTAEDSKKASAQASRPTPPLAEVKSTDPLKDPESYLKTLPGVGTPDTIAGRAGKTPDAMPAVKVISTIPAPIGSSNPAGAAPGAPLQPPAIASAAPSPDKLGLLKRLFGSSPTGATATAPAATSPAVSKPVVPDPAFISPEPSTTTSVMPSIAPSLALPPPATPAPTATPPWRGFLPGLFGQSSAAPVGPRPLHLQPQAVVEETHPPRGLLTRWLWDSSAAPAATATASAAPALGSPQKTTGEKATPPLSQGLLARLFSHSADAPAVAAATPPPVQPAVAPKPRMPMGMGSILALRSPRLTREDPVGQMVVVEGHAMIVPDKDVPLPSAPVTAPNAFTLNFPQGTIPASAVMQGSDGLMVANASMPQTAVAEGMNNAFTRGGSTRPVPADYGMAYQDQNAFMNPGVSGMVMLPATSPTQGGYARAPMTPPQGMTGFYPQQMMAAQAMPAGYSPGPMTASASRERTSCWGCCATRCCPRTARWPSSN